MHFCFFAQFNVITTHKTTMAQPFLIDIDAILHAKMGSKAKWVPGFLVSYLKKIVHQDWLNDFITKEGDKQGVEWIRDCMKHCDIKIKVEGMENLPDDSNGQRFTFVSNHPLGGPDGLALGLILGDRYDSRIKYLVNDLLMNLSGLAPLFVGINKTGKQSRDFPRMVEAVFSSDNHVIMFPAGICSRKVNGVIQDLDWKKTFVTKSVETHRDIVPIHFGGRNSDFFYRLANVTKALGIKFNIAMLYLVDELYKNQHKEFTIKIGKPIPYENFTREKTPVQWAALVRDIVYKL